MIDPTPYIAIGMLIGIFIGIIFGINIERNNKK
jgi:uncharacterized membrane-anchored protein YhcB (DUF1043 family)